MIEIIATAAVSGIAGTAIGFSLTRPWQDWTIKRINKDRADLRRENDLTRTAREREKVKIGLALMALTAERDEALKALAAAGKPDQPRDPITGRWLSKEAA